MCLRVLKTMVRATHRRWCSRRMGKPAVPREHTNGAVVSPLWAATCTGDVAGALDERRISQRWSRSGEEVRSSAIGILIVFVATRRFVLDRMMSRMIDMAELESPNPTDVAPPLRAQADEGGESACWVHLTCPSCGAMIATGHRVTCDLDADRRPT